MSEVIRDLRTASVGCETAYGQDALRMIRSQAEQVEKPSPQMNLFCYWPHCGKLATSNSTSLRSKMFLVQSKWLRADLLHLSLAMDSGGLLASSDISARSDLHRIKGKSTCYNLKFPISCM